MSAKETTIFASQHRMWLADPMTKALLAALNRHDDFIANALANKAMDKDVTPEFIRLLSAQLATTKSIKKLIYDTETFTAKCSTS